jgi:crotonobetainyl-CoA:carnitine CoA-transferase CaiB-like acyl-CoA transferase
MSSASRSPAKPLAESTRGDAPLSDLRVLDLSRVMAGPYAGRLLRDMGADVVKVEPPEGDITRTWGAVQGGMSGFYSQQNAGKRNVCIDLRCAGGPSLVKRLAGVSDILIENFRPGVLARWGLAFDDLASENPRLIMLSVTGFGQTGPESHRPAYAPVLHAESGFIARHAEMDGHSPSDPIFSLADSYAALHGSVALLSALHMRERTGRGQHIDLNMLRALVATDDYTHHVLDGALPPERLGGQVLDAPGGPILISAFWKGLWHQAKTLFGVTADDGDCLDEKIANRQAAVREWVASYDDRDALKRDLDKAGLPWGDVRTMEQVPESPTLRAASWYGEIDDRAGGIRRVVQAPYEFSDASAHVRGPAPHRGEHNGEVLRSWLGATADEIREFEDAGVLLTDERV